jgi:hypothetical protein
MIGGTAVYFGYRLFLLLPTQNDSSGKIELPGFSVVMAKIGPGIFFAAFGSALVLMSLTNPLKIKTPKLHIVGATEFKQKPQTIMEESETSISQSQTAAPQIIEKTRQAVQVLNCIEQIITERNDVFHKDDLGEPIRLAKAALIGKIWNENEWGSKGEFESWTMLGVGNVSSAVREIYNGIYPGCPGG